MQVSKVNIDVPKQITKQNNGRETSNNNIQSFKGIGMMADKFALGVANAIENGGLAVSFTLQDMLGTNLPRPIMGLRRNKKENKGAQNTKFAAKELVREMLTGPSMFFIPGTMLAIGKKVAGKTVGVPAQAIDALGDIHAAQPLTQAGEAIGKQEFYKNAFSQIIKNAKSETEASKETLDTAADFARRLINGAKDKASSKEAITSISSDFIDISKKYATDAAHTDFTQAALSGSMKSNIKNTISYITSYADDVVEKAKSQDKSKITEYIKNTANKKVIGRFALNLAMFGAVMTFLQVIPKLYNKAEGKDNAGLKGLMKEETLRDDYTQKDKSKPSFGSAAGIAKTITGSGIVNKFARAVEFSGPSLSFPLLVGVMGFGIMFPRLKNAKDKYDREEILRRDAVTCAVMCVGEKQLRKGFSKLNENKSGLVLAAKEKGFSNKPLLKRVFNYLRPINGVQVLSSNQIVSKYSNIEAYKDGFKGFCDFISGQGGNLSKVFGLTKDSSSIVGSLLEKEGTTLAKADNETITKVLDKAKDSEEIKKLTELFKDKNNPWVTKAKTLNARFTALSVLVLVPVFLGFMLPWINEKTTKRKFREDNTINRHPQTNALVNLNYKTSDLFKDMANFKK